MKGGEYHTRMEIILGHTRRIITMNRLFQFIHSFTVSNSDLFLFSKALSFAIHTCMAFCCKFVGHAKKTARYKSYGSRITLLVRCMSPLYTTSRATSRSQQPLVTRCMLSTEVGFIPSYVSYLI